MATGSTQVEHHDGVGIDRGDIADEPILIAWQTEHRQAAAPRKHDHRVRRARDRERLLVIGLALLGRHPREPYLHRLTGGIALQP